MRFVACGLLAALSFAAENQLTPEEKRSGYRLLFDGKSFRNWAYEKQPGDSWMIEDGAIRTKLKPRVAEDLLSSRAHGDFELLFDWRVSEGGNTGLKYRVQREIFVDESTIKDKRFEDQIGRELREHPSDRAKLAPGAKGWVYTVAFEFQLIDDQRHPDARKDERHRTGALYSMIPAQAQAARPAGEWNQSRLVARGNRVEHWINGTKVLDASLDDPRVAAGVGKRWAPAPDVANDLTKPKPAGKFCLQHHGDLVWFRNLKIRELK